MSLLQLENPERGKAAEDCQHSKPLRESRNVLECGSPYGGLKDWRDLFAAAHADKQVAELVLKVASQRDLGGASILARTRIEDRKSVV